MFRTPFSFGRFEQESFFVGEKTGPAQNSPTLDTVEKLLRSPPIVLPMDIDFDEKIYFNVFYFNWRETILYKEMISHEKFG